MKMSEGYYQKFDWTKNPKQQQLRNLLMNPPSRRIQHILLRGSVGSGKSVSGIAWAFENALDRFPGAKWLVMRRTHSQIKGSIWEQTQDFNRDYRIPVVSSHSSPNAGPPEIVYPNGSKWMFWSSQATVDPSGKGSDTARGLGGTQFSGATLEEADRIHKETIDTVPNRLREKSGIETRVIFYNANPTPEGHWLHKMFRQKDYTDPDHQYHSEDYHEFHFTIDDNLAHLPPNYKESQEAFYRNKPGLYKRMFLGEWGPELKGTPIYGRYFRREFHVNPYSFVESWEATKGWQNGPVCLGFDFGYKRPALTVMQDVKIGSFQQLRFLMAFLGDEVTIRIFAKYHLELIYKLLPNAEILTYCDPAGSQADGRGVTEENAIDVLKSLHLNPQYKKSEKQGGCDLIIKLLQEVNNHPVVGMQPAISVEPLPQYTEDLVNMFETGYSQEEETTRGQFKPIEDQYYIHIADATRYDVIHRRRLDEDKGLAALRTHQYRRIDGDMLGRGLYVPEPVDMDDLMGESQSNAYYGLGRSRY